MITNKQQRRSRLVSRIQSFHPPEVVISKFKEEPPSKKLRR